MAFASLVVKGMELAQTGLAKTSELVGEGKAKAKELAEVSKLKMENMTEQEAIKKAYLELGRLYYAEQGENPAEPYAALCEKITASKAKIEYNQERIADIKAAGSVKDGDIVCECDAECAEDAPAAEEPCGCGCEEEAPTAEEPKTEE